MAGTEWNTDLLISTPPHPLPHALSSGQAGVRADPWPGASHSTFLLCQDQRELLAGPRGSVLGDKCSFYRMEWKRRVRTSSPGGDPEIPLLHMVAAPVPFGFFQNGLSRVPLGSCNPISGLRVFILFCFIFFNFEVGEKRVKDSFLNQR